MAKTTTGWLVAWWFGLGVAALLMGCASVRGDGPARGASVEEAQRQRRVVLREGLASAQAAVEADPQSVAARLGWGRALYLLAAEEKGDWIGRAAEALSALDRDAPGQPVVQAYLGSVRLLESEAAWAPWTKERLARQGLELLDGAVAAAPEDLEIRFIRAQTTAHLPDFFERAAQSRADFAWLAARVSAAASAGTFPPDWAAAVLLRHGRELEAQGQAQPARAAYAEAVELAPRSVAAAEARALLGRPAEVPGE